MIGLKIKQLDLDLSILVKLPLLIIFFKNKILFTFTECSTLGIMGRFNKSESWVKNYSALLFNIVSHNLNYAKNHQTKRETKKVSEATFDFTEKWFRNSGLYDLNSFYQMD